MGAKGEMEGDEEPAALDEAELQPPTARSRGVHMLRAIGPPALVVLNVLLAASLFPALWVVPAAFYAGSSAVMPYPIALGSAVGTLGAMPLVAALVDVRGSPHVGRWRRGSLRSMMLTNTYAQGMVACFLSFIAPAVFSLLLQTESDGDSDGPIGGARVYEGVLPSWLLLLHFLFQLGGFTLSAVASALILFAIR